MAIARPNLTRPLPRARRAWPVRHVTTPGAEPPAGSTLPAQLGPWNFTGRAYISFDPPSASNPMWLEVTEFVDLAASTISITRGRQDGLADVSVGTCSLVVDNTDGRWTPTNAVGAWYGQIRKGAWLRIDVLPPSGTVSTRFVGFITALPTVWDGLYAHTAISASDRFLLLGQAPLLPAMTSAEVVFDSSTGPVVQAHYPLSEAQAGTGFALAFGDVTGNVSPPLVPVPWGGATYANYLNYVKAQGASAPGFDGNSCVQFQPAAIGQGAVLTTTVAPWNNYSGTFDGNYGVLEFWIQTTFANTSNPIASLWDPTGASAVTAYVDGSTGYLSIVLSATTAASTYSNITIGPYLPSSNGAGVVLNDGNWHYVSIAVQPFPTLGDTSLIVNIDGKTVSAQAWIVLPSSFLDTIVIGGGWNASSQLCFTGNIAGVSWILTGTRASNYPAHYQAGYQGFYGEAVDYRIARVARYAGIPEPTSLQVPAAGYNPVPIYSGTKGPWTNLSPCIHHVGTQSIIGRQPLDVMREAARTEGMPLYVDRAGYLTIQPCTARYNTASSWSVDARDIDPSTAFSDDFQYLTNQISVTPNGGATQTVNGAAGLASQDQYGVYNASIQSASLNATEAANLALSVIGANADPVPRIGPLVIEAATLATQTGYGNAWYDAVLATDISTVATVTGLPSQAPAPSMSVFIEGYTETIGLGQHTFSFSTSPQTYTNAFRLDSSHLDDTSVVLAY